MMGLSMFQTNFSRFHLLIVIFVVAVAAKPSKYRILFFPLICVVYAAILFLPTTSRLSPNMEYQFGLTGGMYIIQSSSLILLSEPQLSLRRKDQKKPAADLTFYQRLRWALNLIINSRGVNWSFEAPGLRHSSLPRWEFVKTQLKWAAFFYLLSDASSLYMVRSPQDFNGSAAWADGTQAALQGVHAIVFWFSVYAFMQFSHTLASVVAVSLGISEPSDWPAWFGPLSNTTSIRKFWGQTWHQGIRQMVSTHGKYLANDLLGLKKGGFLSSYTQLYVAFLISGTFHATGDYALTHNLVSFKKNIIYYMLQAVAITFEDGVVAIGKRLGIRAPSRVIGYIWVLFWLGLSSPIWFSTLRAGGEEGLSAFGPPFSIISRVLPK